MNGTFAPLKASMNQLASCVARRSSVHLFHSLQLESQVVNSLGSSNRRTAALSKKKNVVGPTVASNALIVGVRTTLELSALKPGFRKALREFRFAMIGALGKKGFTAARRHSLLDLKCRPLLASSDSVTRPGPLDRKYSARNRFLGTGLYACVGG